MSRETHISTEQPCSQTPPRISVPHGDEKRPESAGQTPCKRPQTSERVAYDENCETPNEQSNLKISPEIRRLKTRSEFVRVAKGHSERRRSIVVQALRSHSEESQIGAGFTTTKKIGNAVIRNRARRRMREACKTVLPPLATMGTDYVFIARKDTAQISWAKLLDDMKSALISLRDKIESGVAPTPRGKSPRRSQGVKVKASRRGPESKNYSSGHPDDDTQS